MKFRAGQKVRISGEFVSAIAIIDSVDTGASMVHTTSIDGEDFCTIDRRGAHPVDAWHPFDSVRVIEDETTTEKS